MKKEKTENVNIAAIIACRLKSSRLKKKAILKIGNLTSIELCIKNTLKIKNINNVVLATSDNKEDMVLSKYIYDDSVIFHRGDAQDVVSRYLDIIKKLDIDVFLRVTGDMPYVSSEITEYLIKKHFESGADYTAPLKYTVGTDVEIINSEALKKVQKYFPSADYSEYMTWYFQNNPKFFNLNFVDLPKEWVRDYRLTLDYKEDLVMFNQIEKYFNDNKIDFNIFELYKFLDNNPKISEINNHLSLSYKTDKELIKLLNKMTKIKEVLAK